MMDATVQKLAIKLGDPELAEALVEAGYDNPAKLRKATDKDLEKVVGKSKLSKVRGKFKARK